jgi:hypothetical protein
MGRGHVVKSLICEKFREAMGGGGVNSKEGPKGKLFAFLDQERGCCQGPKAWGPSPGCRSNCLERYAARVKEGPVLCPRTPRANPCLSEM